MLKLGYTNLIIPSQRCFHTRQWNCIVSNMVEPQLLYTAADHCQPNMFETKIPSCWKSFVTGLYSSNQTWETLLKKICSKESEMMIEGKNPKLWDRCVINQRHLTYQVEEFKQLTGNTGHKGVPNVSIACIMTFVY